MIQLLSNEKKILNTETKNWFCLLSKNKEFENSPKAFKLRYKISKDRGNIPPYRTIPEITKVSCLLFKEDKS